MKRICLLILLVISIQTPALSQTYSFNKKEESFIYYSNGEKKSKLKPTNFGNYKFYFELGTDEKTQLFTVYENGNEIFWAARLRTLGYMEVEDGIYQVSDYYDTTTQSIIVVMIREDYGRIIIKRLDDTTTMYVR